MAAACTRLQLQHTQVSGHVSVLSTSVFYCRSSVIISILFTTSKQNYKQIKSTSCFYQKYLTFKFSLFCTKLSNVINLKANIPKCISNSTTNKIFYLFLRPGSSSSGKLFRQGKGRPQSSGVTRPGSSTSLTSLGDMGQDGPDSGVEIPNSPGSGSGNNTYHT